jgi:hypothetical protein
MGPPSPPPGKPASSRVLAALFHPRQPQGSPLVCTQGSQNRARPLQSARSPLCTVSTSSRWPAEPDRARGAGQNARARGTAARRINGQLPRLPAGMWSAPPSPETGRPLRAVAGLPAGLPIPICSSRSRRPAGLWHRWRRRRLSAQGAGRICEMSMSMLSSRGSGPRSPARVGKRRSQRPGRSRCMSRRLLRRR